MASAYELARGIFVARDELVALLQKHGADAFATHVVIGCLVKFAAAGSVGTRGIATVGMVIGVQDVPASIQPATPAQRVQDAASSSSATVALMPLAADATAVQLVKCQLIVAVSSTEKHVVGLADIMNDTALPEAEHAAFAARVARTAAVAGPGALVNTGAEFAAAVRRRIGRSSAALPAVIATVPLADLLAKLGDEERRGDHLHDAAKQHTATLKRVQHERDTYRRLVLQREAELGDALATASQRIQQEKTKADADAAAAREKLGAMAAKLKACDAEKTQIMEAFETVEASVVLQQQRTKALVAAVAAFVASQQGVGATTAPAESGGIATVDAAVQWLQANTAPRRAS